MDEEVRNKLKKLFAEVFCIDEKNISIGRPSDGPIAWGMKLPRTDDPKALVLMVDHINQKAFRGEEIFHSRTGKKKSDYIIFVENKIDDFKVGALINFLDGHKEDIRKMGNINPDKPKGKDKLEEGSGEDHGEWLREILGIKKAVWGKSLDR